MLTPIITMTHQQAVSLLMEMDKSLSRWKEFDAHITASVNKDLSINKQSYTQYLILSSIGIDCKPDKVSTSGAISKLKPDKALLVKRKLASIKSLVSQAYNKPRTVSATTPVKWKERALALEAENKVLKNRIAGLIGELKTIAKRKGTVKRNTATA